MKKITILAIAALAISFASCKKDRTCTCTTTTTITGGGSSTGTAQVTKHKKIKKGQAIAVCHDTEETFTGGSATTACTLS
jgi:hypothetical protein